MKLPLESDRVHRSSSVSEKKMMLIMILAEPIGDHRSPKESIRFHRSPKESIRFHRSPYESIGVQRSP